jgi:hypothetical protein
MASTGPNNNIWPSGCCIPRTLDTPVLTAWTQLPPAYPGLNFAIRGSIKGCHCAKKVIAVITRQPADKRNDGCKRTPHDITACEAENERAAPDTVAL